MIEFKCECGKYLKLPHSYAGQQTQCPACLRTVQVPDAAPAKAPAALARAVGQVQSLCVDCGGTFPTSQLLTHNGQAVCMACYEVRKRTPPPKPPRPRKKRRRTLRWVILIGGVALVAATIVVLILAL